MKPILEAKSLGIKYRRYVKRTTTLKEAVIKHFKGTRYEAYWALRHVDLTIERGESLGVIGPNGAGKSTLLKAISGILPPSEGHIDVRGKIATLLSIGGAFRADLTGRENVMLHGAIWGISKRQMKARLDGIVEFAGLHDFIDSPLSTYSSGMRARLGFAVATDIDPEILLLDEILSVGDAEFRMKALNRMEQFFKQDKTIIIVSHSLDYIQQHCTRAVYLRAGHLLADGKPSNIIAQYMHDVQNPM